MDSSLILSGLGVDVMHILVFIGLLILLAYANEALFEELIAKIVVDPLVIKTGKEWIKKLQPFLVLVAAGLISYGLGEPLTKVLSDVVPLPALNDPVISPILNALILGAAAFKVHDRAEAAALAKQMQAATLDIYKSPPAASSPGG